MISRRLMDTVGLSVAGVKRYISVPPARYKVVMGKTPRRSGTKFGAQHKPRGITKSIKKYTTEMQDISACLNNAVLVRKQVSKLLRKLSDTDFRDKLDAVLHPINIATDRFLSRHEKTMAYHYVNENMYPAYYINLGVSDWLRGYGGIRRFNVISPLQHYSPMWQLYMQLSLSDEYLFTQLKSHMPWWDIVYVATSAKWVLSKDNATKSVVEWLWNPLYIGYRTGYTFSEQDSDYLQTYMLHSAHNLLRTKTELGIIAAHIISPVKTTVYLESNSITPTEKTQHAILKWNKRSTYDDEDEFTFASPVWLKRQKSIKYYVSDILDVLKIVL